MVKFQSTLPVWGATKILITEEMIYNISIHAPRVGSDNTPFEFSIILLIFQSTLPVWGATLGIAVVIADNTISIHAPRVGSDTGGQQHEKRKEYFNPRSPCGERLM